MDQYFYRTPLSSHRLVYVNRLYSPYWIVGCYYTHTRSMEFPILPLGLLLVRKCRQLPDLWLYKKCGYTDESYVVISCGYMVMWLYKWTFCGFIQWLNIL